MLSLFYRTPPNFGNPSIMNPFAMFHSSNQTPPPRSPPQFPPPGVPRLDLPADENVDLEELEQFAKEFKQRRIKLGM